MQICTAYRHKGKQVSDLPFGPADLSPFQPVYEELPGWQADLSGARAWEDLPQPARDYIRRIETCAACRSVLFRLGRNARRWCRLKGKSLAADLRGMRAALGILTVLLLSACSVLPTPQAITPFIPTRSPTPTTAATIQWFPPTNTPTPFPTGAAPTHRGAAPGAG